MSLCLSLCVQPFREHVYYPLDAAMAAPAPAVPTFGFRARQGSPDWRRLSAVDVERVERERDVALLQEHLAHITFCSAEREYCPHCRGPADPLLLKLLRLAQLATEYLLHCQDGLATQLHTLEQALEAARAERDQLGEEAARHGQEVQRLQEECRRRKRMISALQRMLEAGASCHQVGRPPSPSRRHVQTHSRVQTRIHAQVCALVACACQSRGIAPGQLGTAYACPLTQTGSHTHTHALRGTDAHV